jgi:hypothetical protein
MKLDWDRPGLVRATLKVEELAALVAGARLAAAALAVQSPDQAGELGRVLASFDRALSHLRSPDPVDPKTHDSGSSGGTSIRPVDGGYGTSARSAPSLMSGLRTDASRSTVTGLVT